MNIADVAQLVLTLSLKDEVSQGLKGIQSALDKTNTKGATLQGGLTKVGQGLGVGIKNTTKIGIAGFTALWSQVDAGIDSLAELEDVTAQTEAVIKSTGGAAGLTAEDIRNYAQEMEELSGVDDKVIQSGENVLLTFKNIKSDAFEPAMIAALDMSEAMDQDLQTSILQIGKALNDPDKGLMALKKIGVTFDEETTKMIEDMVAMGDTAGAQQLIIDELNSEFGGSAQASMEGYRGAQLRLKDTVEELQVALAEALFPALKKVSEKLREFLKDPEVKEGIKKLGEGIADLFSDENIKGGGDALKGLFTFLKELPWAQIKDGLQFAADNAKKVVDVFRSLPPGVQAGLLTFLAANKLTGGLVASGLGELAKVALSSLKTITAANVTVIGASVTGVGGVPGVPGTKPGGLGSLVGTATKVTIAGAVAVVGIQALGELGSAQLRTQGFTEAEIERLNGITSDIASQSRNGTAQRREIVSNLEKERQAIYDARTARMAQAAQQTTGLAGILNRIHVAEGTANTKLESVGGKLGQAIGPQGLAGILGRVGEQKQTSQRGNEILSESRERLGMIQTAAQRTANKDLSVNTTVHTTLQVSAAKVAQAIVHYGRQSGGVGGQL